MPETEKDFDDILLDFYKEAYLHETEVKEKMGSRLTLNLAVLSVTVNICVSYLNNLPPYKADWITYSLYGLIGAAIVLGLVSLFFFFRALGFPFGYEYGFVPTTTDIYKYFRDAEAFNKNLPDDEKIDLKKEFRDNLAIQYKGYASRNAMHNHKKSDHIWTTIKFSIWSIIFLFLSAPFFYILNFTAQKKSQPVEIINSVKIEK